MLLGREHKKLKVKPGTDTVSNGRAATPPNVTTASTSEAGEEGEEEEELGRARELQVSYCKIDYPTVLEVTQLRFKSMREKLDSLAKDRCPNLHS